MFGWKETGGKKWTEEKRMEMKEMETERKIKVNEDERVDCEGYHNNPTHFTNQRKTMEVTLNEKVKRIFFINVFLLVGSGATKVAPKYLAELSRTATNASATNGISPPSTLDVDDCLSTLAFGISLAGYMALHLGYPDFKIVPIYADLSYALTSLALVVKMGAYSWIMTALGVVIFSPVFGLACWNIYSLLTDGSSANSSAQSHSVGATTCTNRGASERPLAGDGSNPSVSTADGAGTLTSEV